MNKSFLLFLISSCFIVLLFFSFFKVGVTYHSVDDYRFQTEQYNDVYQKFTQARDAYLTYKTLSSKDEAIKATKKLIIQRNDVLRAYFLALKWRLRNAPGQADIDYRTSLITLLDKEISWLESYNAQVNKLATPSLEDLFLISDRIENREKSFYQLSYRSLSSVLLGKGRKIQGQSVAITTLLDDKISEFEATRVAQLNDWLIIVENKNYLSQKSIDAAEAQQDQLKDKQKAELAGIYNQSQSYLEQTRDYLNQGLRYQKEIFEIIK